MSVAYAVRRFSHWQGAKNPGEIVYVVATREEAERLENHLSTCSFCGPGLGNYQVGECYTVQQTKRHEPGYGFENVDEADLQAADIDY